MPTFVTISVIESVCESGLADVVDSSFMPSESDNGSEAGML